MNFDDTDRCWNQFVELWRHFDSQASDSCCSPMSYLVWMPEPRSVLAGKGPCTQAGLMHQASCLPRDQGGQQELQGVLLPHAVGSTPPLLLLILQSLLCNATARESGSAIAAALDLIHSC